MRQIFLLLYSVFSFAQQTTKVDFKTAYGTISINPIEKKVSGSVRYVFEVKQAIDTIKIDAQKMIVTNVKINNKTQNTFSRTDNDGTFSINANTGDVLLFAYHGFDTSLLTIENLGSPKTIVLIETAQNIDEVNVIRKRMEDFDVGFLPPVKGVQIYTGTNAVIELANLNGAKSSANPREIFAKVPGLNIWESDGAGIQMGIGGRGLSPDRTANFNTRQNGYDISADACYCFCTGNKAFSVPTLKITYKSMVYENSRQPS